MKEIPDVDQDVRHYIYTTFVETTLPPTTKQVSANFKGPPFGFNPHHITICVIRWPAFFFTLIKG
jgi:hypothetical protein